MSAVDARAWAVRMNGMLLVKTVSPSRQAAMTCWLTFHAGVWVGAGAGIGDVTDAFNLYAGRR